LAIPAAILTYDPVMKRDEALTPLSREHHHALHQALRLKRADESTAAEALRNMVAFFDTEAALHFRVEEEVLLPAYVRDGGADAGDEAIARVLTDHVWIRARIAALRDAGEPTVEDVQELGRRLDDHVRHEERVLFPAIEEALSAEQLDRLGRAVAAAEGR
jgi:hemerythrin-like domain-containing protein